MRIEAALAHAAERIAACGVETARVDAEFLLAHVLGGSRTALVLERERELTEAERARFDELVARRCGREPLAYVLGEWGFRGLTLKVDERALIPRPETEVVVERALARIRRIDRPRVLDVGVGSGAIALAIAAEHLGAHVVAIDRSAAALELARENRERAGVDGRVELLHGDVRDGLPRAAYDLVVSNPPYVAPAEIDELEPEVRDWEPREALVGEGAHAVVSRSALTALRSEGWLVLEVGDGQALYVALLLAAAGYGDVTVTRDLAGRERIVEGRV